MNISSTSARFRRNRVHQSTSAAGRIPAPSFSRCGPAEAATIRFIGEVDDERAAGIQNALRRPLLTPAFALEFGSAGVFPAGGAPRVLWLGVVQGASALADLHDEVEGRLQAIGESPENRAFSAHLTLARFRDPDRRDAAAVRAEIQGAHLAAGACPIEEVTLYRSHLTPGGPVYAALLRSSLAR